MENIKSLEERCDIVIDILNQQIEKENIIMKIADKKDDCKAYCFAYETIGFYETLISILDGSYDFTC